MENPNVESSQQPNELEKRSDASSSASTGLTSISASDSSNAGSSEPTPTNSASSAEAPLGAPMVDTGTLSQEEIDKQVRWDKEHPTEEEQERAAGNVVTLNHENGKTTVTDVQPAPSLEEHRDLQAGRTLQDLNPHLAAPPSQPHEEPKKPVAGGPTQPSLDENKFDSLGHEKTDIGLLGPRGAHVSPEHLSEEQKAESAKVRDEREHRGMSSTAAIDSAGNSKNIFRHEEQGYDSHGVRIPDRNTGELVEEAPKHVGPRGIGVPKDTFHRG